MRTAVVDALQALRPGQTLSISVVLRPKLTLQLSTKESRSLQISSVSLSMTF